MRPTGLKELVLIPGHGVCLDPARPDEPDAWRGIYPGEAPLLRAHIERGVAMADDPARMLVFSGGTTRADACPVSEASSYGAIAAAASWWGRSGVAFRTRLEHAARDSLGNLVLALGVFRREVGRYPEKVIVCSYGFKQARFDRHASDVGWKGGFDYVAVNEPREDILPASREGEARKLQALENDPFLLGDEWVAQREARNPAGEAGPCDACEPELRAFLDFLYRSGPARIPSWQL